MKLKTTIPSFIILFLAITGCNQQPSHLSGKMETIEVTYVNPACDCANFIQTDAYYSTDLATLANMDKLTFYIEPANESVKLPEEYFNTGHFLNDLILTGQFYEDEGVPDSYERKTSERPEKAKVFRYDSYRLELKK